MAPRTGTFGRSATRRGRGGNHTTDQAPRTRRPNAAQAVIPRGLRAHTRATASPFPLGGWWTVPEGEPALCLAPNTVPLEGVPTTCI